jgi:hypothetical protein
MNRSYKQMRNPFDGATDQTKVIRNDLAQIPFDPANTDYQKFKADLADGIELQDPDGNVMSAEQVSAFLETLP